MRGRGKNQQPKPGPPKPPPQTTGGEAAGGPAGFGIASSSGLASFSKSQFLLAFALSFVALMIVAAWFLRRPWLAIVALVLALAVGGVFWLWKKRADKLRGYGQLLNEEHDRRDYPASEESGSLVSQAPPSQDSQPLPARASSQNAPRADFILFKESYHKLEEKLNGIDSRLAALENHVYYPTNPKSMEERRSAAEASTSPSRRSAPAYSSYQEPRPRPSSIDLPSLNQAVCRFLADQTAGWEIDRLVQSVRGSMDGNAPIDVQRLGPYSSGEWRLVALWPESSSEGLVLVSSGELVDDEIAKYFDVGYGRRIIACKQPARVARSGGEVSVLQKGRVESS